MRIIDIILSITILISSAVNTIIGKDDKLMNYSEDKLNELEIYNSASLEKFILERNFESLLGKSNKVFSHNIEQDLIDNSSNVKEDNSYPETNRFNRENNLKDSVIRDGYGAYIEDGYIKFGEKNKSLRIFTKGNYENGGVKLEVAVNDYDDTRELENTYGYLVGEEPISLGGLDSGYYFETAIIKGVMVEYPNIVVLDKNYQLDDKSALSFKSKDGLIEFSLVNLKNYNDDDSKYLYKEETSYGEVLESKCGDDWFYSYTKKNGEIIYSLKVLDGDRLKGFSYKFPVQYKDEFKPIIERSRKTFEMFNGFPKIIN